MKTTENRGRKAGYKHSRETRDKMSLTRTDRYFKPFNTPTGYSSSLARLLKARDYRKQAVLALGNKCVQCNFSDTRALQIDHINGGGSRERKERNYKGDFHRHVLASFMAGENKYQLLCANCNWIKRFDEGEYRVGGIITHI